MPHDTALVCLIEPLLCDFGQGMLLGGVAHASHRVFQGLPSLQAGPAVSLFSRACQDLMSLLSARHG